MIFAIIYVVGILVWLFVMGVAGEDDIGLGLSAIFWPAVLVMFVLFLPIFGVGGIGTMETKKRLEALSQVSAWREEGWLVRVTMMPANVPFVAQGSASEYNPAPDVTLDGTEGWVSCELSWLHYDENPPVPSSIIHSLHFMAPTFHEAVEGVRQKMIDLQERYG